MLRWWRTRRAVKRWMAGAQLRYDFAFFAINEGLAIGDAGYYRYACTVDEFEHLVDVVEAELDVRQDKVEEARSMIHES